jgi:hypothetical protein
MPVTCPISSAPVAILVAGYVHVGAPANSNKTCYNRVLENAEIARRV